MDSKEYFKITTPPSNIQELENMVQGFISYNKSRSRLVALVTSGGTTVPLEMNTVRFLDNFSAGTRGATSAEYLIEHGYTVIFLHRRFSLEPYTRHYSHSRNCFLDMLESTTDGLAVSSRYSAEMKDVWHKYQDAKQDQLLLKIDFTTLGEYLFLLRSITQQMAVLESDALFYLAAAVSDFFLPEHSMAQHKIQSGSQGLSLALEQVPKCIAPLVSEWSPLGYTVSFKLETDASLLIPKAKAALEKYGHQLVIGNMLDTRKHLVWFVTPNDVHEIRLISEQQAAGVEIESFIIASLVKKHQNWISAHRSPCFDLK